MSNTSNQKSNYHESHWSKFNQENFILGYLDKDCADLLQIGQQNVNLFMDYFLKNMNTFLNAHSTLRKS